MLFQTLQQILKTFEPDNIHVTWEMIAGNLTGERSRMIYDASTVLQIIQDYWSSFTAATHQSLLSLSSLVLLLLFI